MAGPDLITVVEIAGIDLLAVEVSAVAAAHVHDAAARRIDLDEEVDAREILVLGRQLKVSAARSTDQERIMSREGELLPLVWAIHDSQRDAHKPILHQANLECGENCRFGIFLVLLAVRRPGGMRRYTTDANASMCDGWA